MGSTVHAVTRFLGRELVFDSEVTQWNPPDVSGLKAKSGPLKFEVANSYEPKDGGTLLLQSYQAEIGGFFKVAEGLAVRQLQKQFETDANAAKMLLEAK